MYEFGQIGYSGLWSFQKPVSVRPIQSRGTRSKRIHPLHVEQIQQPHQRPPIVFIRRYVPPLKPRDPGIIIPFSAKQPQSPSRLGLNNGSVQLFQHGYKRPLHFPAQLPNQTKPMVPHVRIVEWKNRRMAGLGQRRTYWPRFPQSGNNSSTKIIPKIIKINFKLVGHVIKGGGVAITGQEQRQLGGGFLEGPDAPKGSGGFLGEVTMVQFYKIALTAGKAYNDHRHHHSVHASTTPAPPPPPTSEEIPTTEHPFLENGQLKRKIPVFELAESLRPKLMPDSNQQLDSNAFSGLDSGLSVFNSPFQGAFLPGLDASVLTPYMMHFPDHNLFKRNNGKQEDTRNKRNGESSQGNVGVNNSELKVTN